MAAAPNPSVDRVARGGTLVLGGGFAGAMVARLLGEAGATIVSPENSMLFTPLLPEAASGTIESRHVVVPLRLMCPHADVVLGEAVAVDQAARTVEVSTEDGPVLVGYADLVVAVGSVSRTLDIPGLAEHAVGFRTFGDALFLRDHVLHQLELADAARDAAVADEHLSFVFVGGGYAGVEALAELRDLVRDAIRLYPRLRGRPQRWVLVEAAPKILSEIPPRLGEYAARRLADDGVEIRVGTRLESAGPRTVRLSDGDEIPTRTLVWTAGVRATPAVERFGLPLDERGRIPTRPTLQVEGHDRVWALGDCAAVPNEATPERPDPPTSQHALRQARRLSRNLRARRDGQPLRPYRYRMLGQVATLGRYRGIAEVFGLEISGFPGWFVTRSYHLYQLPLASRRARVVSDWTLSLLFRRDVAEFGTLRQRRPLPAPPAVQSH